MNYIFGPVNSRRLGRSLGVDLFREKICTLNCIYCEIGATRCLTCTRAEYEPTAAILAELAQYMEQEPAPQLDCITITASGEPTLHSGLGAIIAHIKNTLPQSVAVLTNGTLLGDAQVCQELALADVVIPSLDSARTAGFRKVDRPAACLDLRRVIQGIEDFSRSYQGTLWLEILLVAGMNDSEEEIAALGQAVSRMRIDRIQLNTVARPPLEVFARPLSGQKMAAIAEQFRQWDPSRPVDVLAGGLVQPQESDSEPGQSLYSLSSAAGRKALLLEVVEMLKRRPCTAADINRTFHLGGTDKVEQWLDTLVQEGLLQKQIHEHRPYYLIP
jgi:wyosine [tRNA(Phe)-imidazoG37] synthetase (radical SAM superfamily)